jgi:hypothetical protein
MSNDGLGCSNTYPSCREGTQPICALVTSRREAWISERRRGRVLSHGIGVRWPSPAARRRWVAAGKPGVNGGYDMDVPLPGERFHLGNATLTYDEVLSYRPTPAGLYGMLRAGIRPGQGPSRDGELYTLIGDALREQPAPPHLRAALYRALKLVPGVTYLGRVKDRLGRPAVAIARVENGTRRELLFDPDTSVMLAEREVALKASVHSFDAPPGTVIADAVYERQAVVDSRGERP